MKLSKIGIGFCIIYPFLLSVVFVLYYNSPPCIGFDCFGFWPVAFWPWGLSGVWWFLLAFFFEPTATSEAILIPMATVTIVVNLAILYLIGWLISKFINKKQS